MKKCLILVYLCSMLSFAASNGQIINESQIENCRQMQNGDDKLNCINNIRDEIESTPLFSSERALNPSYFEQFRQQADATCQKESQPQQAEMDDQGDIAYGECLINRFYLPHFKLHDYDSAMVDAILQENPLSLNNIQDFNQLAWYLQHAGKASLAIEIGNAILAQFPQNEAALLTLGNAYWDQGETNTAITSYQRYIAAMQAQGAEMDIPERVQFRVNSR